ncbi:MAG: DUF6247 family protein [Sporichthyaceae bacterium]
MLAAELHAEFRSEYAAAVERAREPDGFADLMALLGRWRKRAEADSGSGERLAGVRTGDGADDVPVDELQRRRSRRQ